MFGASLQNCCVSLKTLSKPAKLVRGCSSHRRRENPRALPKLVYIHNPWAYLRAKYQFFKLRFMWDRQFTVSEFIRGAKQSAIVMTNIIRSQDGTEVGRYTTPMGFQQIARDMILSRNDTRLKLIHFRVEDLQRAIPMKVALFKRGNRKNCLVDMIFVGMRNTRDFPNPDENKKIQDNLRQLDDRLNVRSRMMEVPHRILFAEIYMRFYRDYAPMILDDWSVSFYKIISFDILNYHPR